MRELTDTAQKVLEERYYRKGEATWHDLVARVATFFANDTDESNAFYKMMYDLNALPNSPTLMNADTEITSYSACFVLPVEDNIESIFKYYTDAGLISKSGGGVGCNFSSIRPSGSLVGSTGGVASGPISFMQGQDALTEVIKQGGKRRGANMGILDCDHPDVMDMVKVKDEPDVLENFNLSVRVTDEFMEDVTANYEKTTLITSLQAERVGLWNEIIKRAHSSGEPGILFGDTIEKGNLVPHLGELNTTNPCGEQPLLPYESCSLIAINLSNFVIPEVISTLTEEIIEPSAINWKRLEDTVMTAVLFMNRVLDKSEYPIPECKAAMDATRKIGVGIMGLHDMLIQLGFPYDSEEGRVVADRVMQCIADVADTYSKVLGEEEGYYGAHYENSSNTPRRRNAHLTTIAPTGTLSMIADCSSGCEPYFASEIVKEVLDGEKFVMKNKWGSFKGAQEIHWRDHIKMQAVLQKHVDSSISKTINMAADATAEEVREAYEYAWREGCKGVTVYRDGCRGAQVLNATSTEDACESGGPQQRNYVDLGVDNMGQGSMHGNINGVIPTPYKLELPKKLESMRYRVTDNEGEKVYVTVGLLDGEEPVEVFMKHPYELANSYLSGISRLTSLCMRYSVPLKDICKQLQKSSTSVADMPAKLARILDAYQEEGEWMSEVDNPCPECGNKLVPEGGCFSCKHCGYSKCL